jgi:hypothetical protein
MVMTKQHCSAHSQQCTPATITASPIICNCKIWPDNVLQINFAGRQLQQQQRQHAEQHLEIELEDASHLAAATAMFAAMYEVPGTPQL